MSFNRSPFQNRTLPTEFFEIIDQKSSSNLENDKDKSNSSSDDDNDDDVSLVDENMANQKSIEKTKKKFSKVIPFNQPQIIKKKPEKTEPVVIQEKPAQNVNKEPPKQTVAKQTVKPKKERSKHSSDKSKGKISNLTRPGTKRKCQAAEAILRECTTDGQLNKLPPESDVVPEFRDIAATTGADKYIQVPLWYRPFYVESDNYLETAANAELSRYLNSHINQSEDM